MRSNREVIHRRPDRLHGAGDLLLERCLGEIAMQILSTLQSFEMGHDETSDIPLEEMRARLQDAYALTVGMGTLWTFLDERGLTYKRRQLTRRSRTAQK